MNAPAGHWLNDLAPDDAPPLTRSCVVLRDPDRDHVRCGRTSSGRTVLGFAVCDECYEALR